MASENDAGEDISMRRRRLRFRAWHRGTRELDLVLGPFADARAGAMGPAELAGFERLLGEEDTALSDWLLGRAEAPPHHRALLAALSAFRQAAAAQQ
jgi:antitoxin CptB